MTYAGELSALITAIMWTGSAFAFAAATSRVGSVYVNVVRLLAAVIFLLVTIVIGNIHNDISLIQIGYLILSGLVGFVFGDTFLFKSFEYNSARIGMLIMSVAPAMAALLAFIFLEETLTLMGMIGMATTLIGIMLVIFERKEKSTHSLPVSMAGVFYALLGALGQAGGLVLAKSAFIIGPINGLTATFIRAFAATLVLIPLNYFSKRLAHPAAVFKNNPKALAFTLLGAFMGPYLGVTFSLVAISITNIAIAATIMSIVPILMLPTVWILFREKLSWRAIVGACIAVAGVGILFLR
jgi:drug/metabolite transporter (DMT)-like permease